MSTEGRQLTHGSLFAGIGGFDLGFERAGIKTVWQVEIDPFCRKVLEKHWPNVQRFSDIRECRELPWCDILTGGFPCQDVSRAGFQAGIDGERSGLWAEYARIIRQLRPRFAVVENVPGLLDGGIARVLGDLAEIGYDAEWESLPAAAFGAPHIRDRVWILAYPTECKRFDGAGQWFCGDVFQDGRGGGVRPSGARIGKSLNWCPEFVNEWQRTGGYLNPAWIEVLMGYPINWTACEYSETPSSLK